MNLYDDNGYANIPGILSCGMTFNFIIGGRGTGKTYGALRYVLTTNTKFCLMRRTQAQLDTVARPDTNPFKTPVRDLGVEWTCEPVPAGRNIYAFYRTVADEADQPEQLDVMGYAIALSTVANLRGFDMSDVKLLIYDEFIPESHERSIKNESDAFENAYETINRNRELHGERPLQVICLANANDFACPLLIGLDLVGTIENMVRKNKTSYISPQRGIGIFLLSDSPISRKKEKTALYKLTVGSAFHEMAINNAFAGADDPDVVPLDLREYTPVVAVGELCIYRHKYNARQYYVSTHLSGSVGRFSGNGVDMRRFLATYRNIVFAAISSRIYYESHLCKALFLRYCNLI